LERLNVRLENRPSQQHPTPQSPSSLQLHLHELERQEAQNRNTADALAQANKKIEELKKLIGVMESVGARSSAIDGEARKSGFGKRKQGARVTHRGLGLDFDSDEDDDSYEDGDGQDLGHLEEASYRKRIEMLSAHLKTVELRASHAETEVSHLRLGDRRDIDMLRAHAQSEADRLLGINNMLRQQLHEKQKVTDAKILLKLSLLTNENARLKKEVARTNRHSHSHSHEKVVHVKSRGTEVEPVQTARAPPPPEVKRPAKSSRGKNVRIREEYWGVKVSASCWDSKAATALGISNTDVLLKIGAGFFTVINRDDDDATVLRCPIRERQIKRIGLNKNILSVELSDEASTTAGVLQFSCPKASKAFKALEREMHTSPADNGEHTRAREE
jgi:hypothetical protein